MKIDFTSINLDTMIIVGLCGFLFGLLLITLAFFVSRWVDWILDNGD